MKKITNYIDDLNDRIERWCETLSPGQRRKSVFVAFGVYILVGIVVVAGEWSQLKQNHQEIEVRHIQNPIPAVKQMPETVIDSLTEINQ